MKATYVSVWDGGIEIKTACNYNPETKDVTDVESSDVEGLDLDWLDEEYILLDNGEKITQFTLEGEEYIN